MRFWQISELYIIYIPHCPKIYFILRYFLEKIQKDFKARQNDKIGTGISSIFDHKDLYPYLCLFQRVKNQRHCQIHKYSYTSGQQWTQNPKTMIVSPSDRQASQSKHFTFIESKIIFDELLKLSKNGALNSGDRKKASDMIIIDHCQVRNLQKQYQLNGWINCEFQLWNWPQTSKCTEKLNIKEAVKSIRRPLWTLALQLEERRPHLIFQSLCYIQILKSFN